MRKVDKVRVETLIPAGYGKPPKDAIDLRHYELVARRFRIEAEKTAKYWRKQEGKWRQQRIKAQRQGGVEE